MGDIKTSDDIIAEMRLGPIPRHQQDIDLLRLYAGRLEIARKREASALQRIVRDAIIDYSEQYVNAPNDDVERELKERAAIANNWLKQNGFEEEPTNWTKEESPCL